MTYTKPGWKPVTTELNDKRGEYDRMLHRDWCDDGTCWCKRGTSGDSPRDTTQP